MKQSIVAFIVGAIFAVGLAIAGMTNPAKVLAFLDVTGKWDPSLAFVMVGAIGFYAIAYRLIVKREKPVVENEFSIPKNKNLDAKLIVGAILFGIGWGISGFCPGPAIANLATLHKTALTFFAAMLVGAILFEIMNKSLQKNN